MEHKTASNQNRRCFFQVDFPAAPWATPTSTCVNTLAMPVILTCKFESKAQIASLLTTPYSGDRGGNKMMLLDQVNMNQADKKWALVLARDASADGQFVYAVRSTKVFCRPSCPSRRPRRE